MRRNDRSHNCVSLILVGIFLILSMAACVSPKVQTKNTEEVGEKNGEVYVLYTSDVHCGVDNGFGYAGLFRIREQLEKRGYSTILADNGDAIQGETLGALTKGESIIKLMNAVGYDVAVPGNHEFDYGMPRLQELMEMAEFPYVSCNFNHNGDLLLAPYLIKEVDGKAIAFVGITTPTTLTTSTPAVFQNENEEFVYGFLEDETGEALYTAVQKAVDDARAEGADFVFALGHLGMRANESPWTYAEVIENTNGIDAFFDGHSHDMDRIVMQNKDGAEVTRVAPGTKLSGIGYCHISAEGELIDTGIWTWTNDIAFPDLLGVENEISEQVTDARKELEEITDRELAKSAVALTIFDPTELDSEGNPIRMVRRAETNLADFCTDAVRVQTGAQIALLNGGGIRDNLKKGTITYGDILRVCPFANSISVIEASGQQILDALEWGARFAPDENGGFLQVSGLQYAIDVAIPNGCVESDAGMMERIEGTRRVKNVLVNGEPIDPNKIYTVAGPVYVLLEHGDGHTAFDGAAVLTENAGVDYQLMIDYITESQGGTIGEEYADPYGQERITLYENRPSSVPQ